MSDAELLTALDEIEGRVRIVRAELKRRGAEHPWALPTSPTVAQRAMRRLGEFDADELAHELNLKRPAALNRAKRALEEGWIVEERSVDSRAKRFRWVGPRRPAITTRAG